MNGLVFSEINPGLNTVELFNGGTSAVNLQNHSLQWTLGDGGTGSVALPSYSLPPQGFVVLGRGVADAGYLSGITFNITSTDFALRLINPTGSGVDFVRAGSSTVTPPTGTTFLGANTPNPTIATNQSLVRDVFVADSNTAAEWRLAPNTSPSRVCARPGLCGTACIDLENDRGNCGGCGNACASSQVCRSGSCVAGGGSLLISEYRLDPVPLVELYNPGPANVPLDGYRVQVVGSSGSFLYTFPSGSRVLAPGKFVAVYGVPGAPDFNSVYALTAAPTGAFTNNAAITLFDGLTGVDYVRFGSSTTPPPTGVSWFGNGVVYPPISSADLSLHRKLDVIDSDDALNWVQYGPSTPGFTCQAGLTLCGGRCVDKRVNAAHCGECDNECPNPQVCIEGGCTAVGNVVFSKLSNVSPERFEIYNGGTTPVTLDGYIVEWVSESGTDAFTFPPGRTLAPGAFLSLIEGTGTSSAAELYMARTIVWTTDIAVSLKNASNVGLDFVRTGASTALPPTGTSWVGSNATNPAESGTEKLTREVRAADTNTAADWRLESSTFGDVCAGNTACGLACVDLQRSAANCGACGNACVYGCTNGVCWERADTTDNGITRLVGGNGVNSGRLEVFVGGAWGQVCDDMFVQVTANVACRNLGFGSAASFMISVTGTSSDFVMDDLRCTGNETSLFECPYIGAGGEDCGTTEAVFVTCQ